MKQVGGNHYEEMGVQPWDAMKAWMTADEYRGFLKGNAIKYLARSNVKGGVEDVKKAAHYLEELIAHMTALVAITPPADFGLDDWPEAVASIRSKGRPL